VSVLWLSDDCAEWSAALARYESVVEQQDSPLLLRRDPWYRLELPALVGQRGEPYLTREELVWIVEWKMARGVWRARNLHLVRANSPEEVQAASSASWLAIEDARKALKALGVLKGVGPATASAVLAVYRPDLYPFFDDLVAAQIPGLEVSAFTVKEYLAYTAALRSRAARLAERCPDTTWTAHQVGLALWSASGGKPLTSSS
jgi:hypothetical protein